VTDSTAGIAEVARITAGSMGSNCLVNGSKAAGKCKYLIGVDGKAGVIIRDNRAYSCWRC